MKNIKRLSCLLLAVVMCFSLSATAFAASASESITVASPTSLQYSNSFSWSGTPNEFGVSGEFTVPSGYKYITVNYTGSAYFSLVLYNEDAGFEKTYRYMSNMELFNAKITDIPAGNYSVLLMWVSYFKPYPHSFKISAT